MKIIMQQSRRSDTEYLLRLLVVVVVVLSSANTVFTGEIVNYLPGYKGELPFKLETGYITVNETELFYYFIESQGNPTEDPLILWLPGGPGCSSVSSIVYELGPIQFEIHNYPGGLPSLTPIAYAWTKPASIIFIDSPVGSGFSYATTQAGWISSDSTAAEAAYQFLRKWLEEHPKYLPVELFIAGDSYSGIIVPLVTKHVVEGIENKVTPKMNLRGYILGSPTTDEVENSNSKIVFAHRMALISDELYETAKTVCQENYVNIDPANTACILVLDEIEKCTHDLFRSDILEPKCAFASPKENDEFGPQRRRYLQEDDEEGSSENSFLQHPKYKQDDRYWCRNFNYSLSYTWANDDGVQEALHVRKGFVLDWKRCNKSLSGYTKDVQSVIDVHRFLSKHRLEVLVNSGDRDMVVPFVGTEWWIKQLNITTVNDWRPWFVNGQIAGYTRKYSERGYRLTYVTVKGAGHPAPEYYRREVYEMFMRFINSYEM